MSDTDPPGDKGELRRRWKANLQNGSIAALRSEGRLAALYVLYAANWKTCEVRCSMRRVAKFMGVQPTTIRRGIAQLLDAGVLSKLGDSGCRSAASYVFLACARGVRTLDTSGAQPCAQHVRTPDTSGAQDGHERCAARAQPVRRLRTLCAHNTVLSIDSSHGISGGSGQASPSGGIEPPSARQGESGEPKQEADA